MNDNRKNEIKKEDKKAFRGYLAIIIVSGLAGAIFSQISGDLREIFGTRLGTFLMNILEQITPYANIVLSTIVIIVAVIMYRKSRKGYELWKNNNEDDDSIEKIEEKLSYIQLITSINMVIGLFFLGSGMRLIIFENLNGEPNMTEAIAILIGVTLCIASCTLIQKKVVNLQKEINPLLKGSVYDSKFATKWIESCDESIKLDAYKSSFKAYISVSTTCAILWLFCVIGFELWDFGIMPLVMVTIIWLVLLVSYSIESIKSSKAKHTKK